MLEALPPPDDSILRKPPANVVTFAIGIEEERTLKPADGIAWQRALTDLDYPTSSLQKVFQRSFTVDTSVVQGTNVAPNVTSRDGWQASYRGKRSQTALYSDGVTLERQEYPGFTDFQGEIRSVCGALNNVLSPSIRTRLSLRYSNALSSEQATDSSYWLNRVEAPFLSVAADERLSSSITRFFTVIDFNNDDITMQVRCGIQPDVVLTGNKAFVFDIDLTHVRLCPFNIESSLEDARLLNRLARKMFQAILTNDYYNELKEQQ
jgi:uncharacterized protein (TIGR04255 family)